MASAEKLKEIKDEYTSSLSDLTINSKPLINMLTMLAEDYMDHATVIVQAVEEHLEKVRSEYKLPVLYLIDSIVKNVGHAYKTLFTQNIVANFCSVFEKVDERIRLQMYKLRQTWSEVFPARKMYALDVRVNAIDPAWPTIAPPPTPSIHVNPKFFNKSAGTTTVTTPSSSTPVTTTAPVDATLDMRAKLISKQKELLDLQQKKIELELLQAKVKLEEQQKQFAMTQKTTRKNSPTITTTASTTTLPSMKTMLTKPSVLSTVAKNSETKTTSSKQTTKISSQVSQAFSTYKVTPPTTNGPRITPVNSALISASSRSVSRDPRLAAKQAIQQQQQLQSTAPPIIEKLDIKSSKSSNNEPVNIEKSDSKQKNNLEVSNKITKVSQPSNTASLPIKDPRLISSKVHGGNNIQSSNTTTNLGNKSGKSGSRTFSGGNSRTKESGIPITNNRNKSKSKQKGGKQSEQVANKVVDITDVNVNKFSKIKSSNDSLKIPRSSSMSRSPTKSSKRKERNNSPLKKSPQSSSSSESPSTKRSPHSKHSRNRHTSNKYDVDMDICNSPSPTPPPPAPPSVGNLVESILTSSSSTNKVDDKSFKDLKGSTKSRNYIRRNRDMSRSPDGMSPNKDIDLRVCGGAPPEKQPRLESPIPAEVDTVVSTLVNEANLKNSITDQIIRDVSVVASKDIDLRQLPPTTTVPALIGKKRSSTDKLETINPKKSKAEMFDVLFGNEDVDLRTLPPKIAAVPSVQPPTPPPPVISSPTSSMNTEDWQKDNESKSSPTPISQHSPQRSSSPPLTTPNTHLATVRAKLANATNRDRLGRPLLYNKLPDDPKERKRTISTTGDVDLRRIQKPPPIKTETAVKQFLQQVEEEHKSGKMSQAQYQNAMEQVITILERQKLRKAKRMESLNDSLDKSAGGGMNLSLQPISDDELSAEYSEEDEELEKMSTKDVDDRQLHVITNLASTPEVDKIDLTSPNSPYEKSNENPTIDLTRPSKDDREEQERDNRDRGRDRDRDERPPRSRRWDGGGNEPWNRQPIRSPWLHPPLGLMEKQNPYNTPWKSPFIGVPPLTGGISLHGPIKDILENRPNVAVGGFVQRPPVVRYGPRSASPPAIGSQTTRELPHADQLVIEYINNDSMRTINIDGNPTEIRYYGETAITMKGDEAREISFQSGTRRITFGEKESYVLAFNDVAREIMIAGVAHRVRLGAPTRELYIDDKWYECFFGGPGIVIEIDREYRVVKLEGPPPQVKIGNKRSDLCVGRINLIINAKNIVPIFLDAKPQKFDIEGKIHTLRFVDALRTVLINEEPFKVDFGGLPKPIIVHNKKHFIRFTRLPPGIKPGYVDIKDMEGQRFVGSPPRIETENSMDRLLVPVTEVAAPPADLITNEPALPMFGTRRPLDVADQPTATGSPDNRVPSPTSTNPVLTSNSFKNINLDLLSSIITPAMAPSSNINASGYNTDLLVNTEPTNPSEIPGLGGIPQPVQTLPPPAQPQTPAIGLTAPPRSLEELTELIQKLQATGILSNVTESLAVKEPNPVEVQDNTIKPVDFAQPETLKIKQPAIISALYSGMQCSSCGVRFPPEHTMKYSRQHLDWHYRQNKKKKHSVRKANSRKWFYDVSDWIQFEEIEDLEEREKSWFENQQVAASGVENNGETAEETPEEIEVPSVDARSAGENPRCDVCYDAFDQFYNEEKEEWHLRMAIRVDDKLYHPLCYEDYKVSLLETEPLEESASLIEIRDETDENTIEDDVKEIKEKEPEPVVIDDEEVKPEEDNSENNPPLLSTEENPINEIKSSEETKEQEDVDDLDNSEQDVCIILPEEEIPIVKIDDTADDEDDVFKENESSNESNESTQNVIKHKMEEVVLADGSIVKIKAEPIDPDIDEPSEEIASTTADNSQISVQSSIDGNVQLDSTVNIGTNVPSGKIKINISKPLTSSSQSSSQSKEIVSHSISESLDSSEPPPPGEEPPPLQIKLKPALQDVNLKVMPPVSKGSELSGLCSIM